MEVIGRKAEKVYRRLRNDIDAGRFPENSALPAGAQLCARYGVSHPTLRKAVAVLAEESRLIVKHGAGTFVAPPPAPKKGASQTVAVMAMDGDTCLRTLQSLLLKDGYLMNVYLQGDAQWSPVEEGKFLSYVKDHRCAALLAFCSPLPPTHAPALRALSYAGVRVIHYEHYRLALPEQEYLLPDYARAGHMAAVKLLIAGYTQLFVVAHWANPSPATRLVEQGFAQAVAEHGGGYDPERQHLCIITGTADHDARMLECVTGLPDNSGVICVSVGAANNLRQGLAAAGRGPGEVGVIGILNTSEPDTSTVDCFGFEREAQMRRLVDLATGDVVTEVKELIAPVWQPAGTIRKM